MNHWLWELGLLLILAIAAGVCLASLLISGVKFLGWLLQRGKRKRKTDLVAERVLVSAPKWVVWSRQDRGRCTCWEPAYVGDNPDAMMEAARRDYPLARGFDLILMENGQQPDGK